MLRSVSEIVFSNFDNWIISGVEAENNSMNRVIGLCRQGIENESPLKFDEEMDFFKIFDRIDVSELINEYLNESNICTNNIGQIFVPGNKCVYSINDMANIMNELKSYECQPSYTYYSNFVDLYVKKLAFNTTNDTTLTSLISGIPESLRGGMISFKNYFYFIGMISENR
jgi:hypothetical protein